MQHEQVSVERCAVRNTKKRKSLENTENMKKIYVRAPDPLCAERQEVMNITRGLERLDVGG